MEKEALRRAGVAEQQSHLLRWDVAQGSHSVQMLLCRHGAPQGVLATAKVQERELRTCESQT